MEFNNNIAKSLLSICPNNTVIINGTTYNVILPFGGMTHETNFKGETYSAKVSNGETLYTVVLTYHEDLCQWFGVIYEHGNNDNKYVSMHNLVTVEI